MGQPKLRSDNAVDNDDLVVPWCSSLACGLITHGLSVPFLNVSQ